MTEVIQSMWLTQFCILTFLCPKSLWVSYFLWQWNISVLQVSSICGSKEYFSPSIKKVYRLFPVRVGGGSLSVSKLNFICFHDLPFLMASLSSTVSWSLLRFTWPAAAAAAANSVQLCPTLCDPIDSGPPGSPVPGILQARTLEWVAISFSNAYNHKGFDLGHTWMV